MHLHAVSVFEGLSFLVAVFAAWTALDLFQQVRSHQGGARLGWLATAATAMGGGVWSMHFIAMLACRMNMEVTYDLPITLGSAVIAVVSCMAGLGIAGTGLFNWGKLIIAGVLMGLGVAGMHYAGMSAMRMPADTHYDSTLVIASVGRLS